MKHVFSLITAIAFTSLSLAQQTPTQTAQSEAVRLYPDIAKAGSDANKAFLKAVEEAKRSHDPVMSQPDWPVVIAKRALSAPPIPAADALVSPARLMGKTFEECEQILGKPIYSGKPDGKETSFTRRYSTEALGPEFITLIREPSEDGKGKIPMTVNRVEYQIPKPKAKTLGEAFAFLRVPTDGAIHMWNQMKTGQQGKSNWVAPIEDFSLIEVGGIEGNLMVNGFIQGGSTYLYFKADIIILKLEMEVVQNSLVGRNKEDDGITDLSIVVIPHPLKSVADEVIFSTSGITAIAKGGTFKLFPQSFLDGYGKKLSKFAGQVQVTGIVKGISKQRVLDVTSKGN